MKKTLLFLFSLLCCTSILANPKHEFRATWLTTGNGLDWPKTTNIKKQKESLISIFDVMARGNMNVACLQVRSFCDALYKSSYEPWSKDLTGTRGKDPGYDPLAFAIEEAHKRGIELHVWVNPFRVTSKGYIDTADLVWKNAGQWIIKYDNGSSFEGQIIDPGYPEARAYVHKVLMEIVTNYDIDGILMDDYFYPYGGTTTQDAASKKAHKPNNVVDVNKNVSTDDDWRRANVDSVIHTLYRDIQKVKPWVRFGMGPFGNWTTKKSAADAYGITLPEGISTADAYNQLYCNPIEWLKHGWVDYLNPQLYWSTQIPAQSYSTLCEWWADICELFSNKLPNGQRVHFFPSQAAYAVTDPKHGGYEGYDDGIEELRRQLDTNRKNLSSGYTGSVFFNTSAYVQLFRDIKSSHFQLKSLCPPMDWKVKTRLKAPTNVTLKDTILSWEHPTAERFTIYLYPRGAKGIAAKKDAMSEVKVPTQEELWESFNKAAGFGLGALNTITDVKTIAGKATEANLKATFAKSEWKWLKTYIMNTQNVQQGTVVVGQDGTSRNVPQLTELIDANNAVPWRYAVAAFFLQTQSKVYPATADFTTAGQPSAWRSAYLGEDTTPSPEYLKTMVYGKSCRIEGWGDLSKFTVAIYSYDRYGVEHEAALFEGDGIYDYPQVIFWELNGGTVDVELPKYVTETYVLPTPKKVGHDFVGWYKTKTLRGEPLTEIVEGWEGTLYASWKENTSAVDNISLTKKMQVYDIMGRYIGEQLPTDQHGIFIVIQGENNFKIVL